MKRSDLTVAKVAAVCGIDATRMRHLATHTDELYYPTQISKDENGKERIIDPPREWPKTLFRRLHRFWQREFRAHGAAHGGVRGRSHHTSARHHLGRATIIARDLSDCYNSILQPLLKCALLRNGFTPEVAWMLSLLFTVHGRVPQGSPLSGDALNEFLFSCDNTLACSAGWLQIEFTRMCDDFELSVDDPELIQPAIVLVEESITKTGLRVNEKKRAKAGLQPADKDQVVHGLVVNSSRGTRVNGIYWLKAVAVAESYRSAAKIATPALLEMLAARRQTVVGHMHNCRQSYRSPAKQIRRSLSLGDRFIRQKLVQAGLGSFTGRWWTTSKWSTPTEVARHWAAKTGSSPTASPSLVEPTQAGAMSLATAYHVPSPLLEPAHDERRERAPLYAASAS